MTDLPVVAELLLQTLRWTLIVGVVLILLAVVLVVHLLGVFLRVVLGLLAVVEVLALGFGQLVDLSTDEAG